MVAHLGVDGGPVVEDVRIVGLQAQIVSLQRQRTLIEPERAAVKDLWDKQLVTINRMNQLERTAADLEGNTAALQAQIAQARARIRLMTGER